MGLFDGVASSTGNAGKSLFGGASSTDTAAPSTTPGTGKSLFERITPADKSTTSTAPGTGTSLFGAAPATTAANTSSLFGGATTNTATSASGATSSLFGNNAQPAQTTASSLFSGLNATSKAAQTSSFPSLNATSQPATSGTSLFGGALGAAAQPSTTGSGLFSMATTSKPATSTSLFGTAPAATSNITGGFLGAAQPAGAQNSVIQSIDETTANPAYFDQLLERGRKRQTEENVTPFGDLPQLELGLADISRKVRNLGQGGPSAELARGGDTTKAHYLLSASGVNTSRALRDLDNLTGIALYENELSSAHGVKRDLARRHQNEFQEMINDHIKSAHDDFDRMIDEQLHGVDWSAHRQRIYEHFGLKKPQALDDEAPESGAFGRSKKGRSFGASANKSFGLSGLSRSVIGAPGFKGARQSQFADIAERMPASDNFRTAPEDRVSRIRQEKYADRVKELNVARIQEAPFPVLKHFADVESDQPDENTAMLLNAYRALVKITGEGRSEDSVKDVKERQYATAYLSDATISAGSSAIRKRVLEGSRRYLEELFYNTLEQTVADHPRDANVGGKPTKIAKVKGYVRVRAARRELGSEVAIFQQLDDNYCWAVIFYLLRAGLVQDAVLYVEENASAFRHLDRKFMNYLRHYAESPERRLPHRDQTEIQNDYTQRAKLAPEDTLDPYRMMCYKVIGRCDLARRTIDGINSDEMDFLWLQFALAREYSRVDELASEAYGLDEVRTTIKDIGERYFGPNSDIPNAPNTLFFMQILAGMFEKAIADLYAHNYVSAVHFAIALDYYGLLRVSDIKLSDELLSYSTRQQAQLAFGSMIGLYTGDFRTANPTAAADYLALICLNADLSGELGRGQRELCHQALTELVLETREFAQLLGDVRADGQRIKGAIELRIKLIGLTDEQDFLRQITLVAARTAEDNGRTTDAALLFHLAEDYDKVVTILNDAVSLALTTDIGEQPQKLVPLKPRSGQEPSAELQGSLSLTTVDDPIEFARNFRSLYSGNQMYYRHIKSLNSGCLNLLLSLADARRALEEQRWANAVDDINAASVLPAGARGNNVEIRSKANAFNELPPVVARTIGHVMIWALVACMNRVSELRHNEFDSPHKQQAIKDFMDTAKDVMLFAGLIRYKLPGRVWEVLARAGQELGVY
ncbi:hypothetical protein AMS68_001621 [Peltaster fructicola]|uniref:Nuclear pore protein n=1 Tax=Peltaster fructicola TaxID=286661 RepID=A0A6H0XMZ6_9PEZI|nr:hypothetical protein AMS68_001621 [Peltaster fructicola]